MVGPTIQKDIWAVHKDKANKPVEMIGLDLWNGNRLQVNAYTQLTGITFPVLMGASVGGNRWGVGLEHVLVVDKEGIVRLINNVSGPSLINDINTLANALVSPAPIPSISLRALYYGIKLPVGQTKTLSANVINNGTGPLEITGYESDVDNLVMEPATFTVPAGQQQTVEFTYTPLKTGTVVGQIELLNTHKDLPPITLGFRELQVEGSVVPKLNIEQTQIQYNQAEVGRTTTQTFTIGNTGEGPLYITSITTDISDVSIPQNEWTIPVGETVQIPINILPTTESTFSGTLTLTSNDLDQPTTTLDISGTAVIVYAQTGTDFDNSGKVDFVDFVGLAQAFGSNDPLYDIDKSGTVDFTDFVTFAQSFGRSISP